MGAHFSPALGVYLGCAVRDDAIYMHEAFELAERGRGKAHPNPLVGAVVVRDGEVVGRGWHLGPGTQHAETAALAEAGPAARGATLYCTLEPCCHYGMTPPCADAVVEAGVARVVVALRDPNPLVDGGGFASLRRRGVAVDLQEGEWGARARKQNAPFVKFQTQGLPFVTYKAAVTLDGKVAGSSGDARWISCLESRRVVHRLRATVDAVMVGAGTVRRDDPELTVRLEEGGNPVRVIVTRGADLPLDAVVFTTARQVRTLVLASESTPAVRRRLADLGVEVIEMGEGGLRAGLSALAERGLLDILFEGGPVLAGALLAEGLLDRLVLFIAPRVVGRGAPDLFAAPAVSEIAQAWNLHDTKWRTSGSDLLLSGAFLPGGE